jgi:hypothetical protein
MLDEMSKLFFFPDLRLMLKVEELAGPWRSSQFPSYAR